MRNALARIAVAGVLATVTFAAAPANAEENVAQFCVDFGDNGSFSPHLAEDRESWEAMLGHRITGFVNTAAGCSGFGEGDGTVFTGPIPEFGSEEPPTTCEPTTVTVVKTVEVPVEVVRYIETSSVQVVENTTKIKRLRAKIKRLRAKLARR